MDPAAGALPLECTLVLDRAHPVPQLGKHRVRRTELGRNGEHHLERIGHGSVGAEEMLRPGRAQTAPGQQGRQPVHAWPVMATGKKTSSQWAAKISAWRKVLGE